MKTRILIIESSSSTCSVGISEGQTLIAEYTLFQSNQHDKMLAEFINRLLSDLSFKISDFDSIAVSAGPGSFTGLRIGAAIAKGLCHGNTPKLIGLPTLESIAFHFANQSKITENINVIISSHKDLAYFQKFTHEGVPTSEVQYLTFEEIVKQIDKNEVILLTGANELPEEFENVITFKITSGVLFELAFKYYFEGNFTDSESFVPFYQQEFTIRTKS